MIVLQNVTKSFGKTEVLSGISVQIDPREFVCITGPSGAGKSTLLSLLIGAESATSGTVMIDDVDLTKVPRGALQIFRRKVGMVFQDYKLLSTRTVAENIAFPLEVCGVPDDEIEHRVEELLRRMNLTSRADALPQELSGGEKARTAIARALAHAPLIVLADEPTGNLDRVQAQAVLALFQEIHTEGTTVIIATHDPNLVTNADARTLHIENGKLVQDGTRRRNAAALPIKDDRDTAEHPEKEEDHHEKHHTERRHEIADSGMSPKKTQRKNIVPLTHSAHHTKKKHPAVKPGGRKIRITAIHSDRD